MNIRFQNVNPAFVGKKKEKKREKGFVRKCTATRLDSEAESSLHKVVLLAMQNQSN